MGYAFNASIYVVGWGDAVQVIDIWFQAQEELDCGIYRHWGDFKARRTYLHDQIVVGLDIYILYIYIYINEAKSGPYFDLS